jgi:N-acetylneuraminate synthase
MKIAGREINSSEPPYVIAEMSGNHNQSLERALLIVEAAANAGAHAVKLQTYTADTMTMASNGREFFVSDPHSPWFGNNIFDLYKKAHTPWEWHRDIIKKAQSLGMACFSSPFDETAVEFLEDLDVPAFKIASFECVDLPLITRVAKTGKPIIISTGMASLSEIDEAVMTAKEAGCRDIAILKCTSTYPSSPENSNLRTISHMKDAFGCQVGLSDHTLGLGSAVAAVAMGATIIEKHLTIDRSDGGVDSEFSLEPDEFSSLTSELLRAWQSLGGIHYGPTPAEIKARSRRRSLYIADNLKEGDLITPKNLKRIRPGNGLQCKYYDLVIGRRVKCDIGAGSPLEWDHLL